MEVRKSSSGKGQKKWSDQRAARPVFRNGGHSRSMLQTETGENIKA